MRFFLLCTTLVVREMQIFVVIKKKRNIQTVAMHTNIFFIFIFKGIIWLNRIILKNVERTIVKCKYIFFFDLILSVE